MNYEWVSGSYEGEKATKVAGLANSGIGYYILADTGGRSNRQIVAAFRRAVDGPTPHHLLVVRNGSKVDDLEKQFKTRMGIM